MEVNWEKTRALAEGSRASISVSSSRSASILVLLWKPASFMRFRMDDFFAFATFTAACKPRRTASAHLILSHTFYVNSSASPPPTCAAPLIGCCPGLDALPQFNGQNLCMRHCHCRLSAINHCLCSLCSLGSLSTSWPPCTQARCWVMSN